MVGNDVKWFHRYKLFVMCLFVIYGAIQKVSVFQVVTTSRLVPLFMLSTAASCLLWDFFRIHSLFKNKHTWIAVGFIGATLISSLLMWRYGVYTNAVIISYLLVEILLMYQFDADRGKVQLYREFKTICITVSIISLAFSLVSLFSYLTRLDFEFVDAYGNIISQGYSALYHRVWGVYYETNYQGIMDVFVIFVSVLFAFKAKTVLTKILWGINFALHLICLVLTVSRSATIVLYVSVFVFGFFVTNKWFRNRGKKIFQLLMRTLCGTVLILLFFAAFQGVKCVMPYLQMKVTNAVGMEFRVKTVGVFQEIYSRNGIEIRGELVNYEGPVGTDEPNDSSPIIDTPQAIMRPDIVAKEDYSNGRIHVWLDGFRLFFRYPVFGMSPGNRAEIVNQNNIPVCEEITRGHTLINGYLEVLVGSGTVGTLLMAFFLIACLQRLMKYDRLYGKNRLEIGCILAILVAFLVFSLFLSELFYMRSLFTYLFWILLGYAMALIRIEEREGVPQQDFAFMCDTPLQVLNAVSFVESNAEDCKGKSDLFLYHQFRGSKELSARLKEAGVFRNVYDSEKICEQTGLKSKLSTFLRLIFPKYTLKRLCRGDKGYFKNQYGTIALSFYTPFSDVLRLALKPARTIQFEDGLGSYVTPDLESSYRSGIFAFINKFIVNGALSYHPQALYLNNPSFCAHTALPVKELVGMAKQTAIADTVKTVYGFKTSLYAEHRVVYLTQPFGPSEGGDRVSDTERQILPLLKKTDPIVRVHPRQPADTFADFTLDTVGNMWELECVENIGSGHVLIGAFSTAQLAPKIMFDREPTLVFLYKLYGAHFNNADELVARVRNAYRDSQKVLVPETVEELQDILTTL